MQDKPAHFLGSKDWIGSYELCLYLDAAFDISCKIIHCPSGIEVSSKMEELYFHFEKEGTPIMLGGAGGARILLGIHYNQTTGQKKFLLLDPHYVGDEDLDRILNEGWCSWENEKFFTKESFYNFCLPLLPK